MRIRSPYIAFLFLLACLAGLFACVPVYRVDDAYSRGYALGKNHCDEQVKVWSEAAQNYHDKLTECREGGDPE